MSDPVHAGAILLAVFLVGLVPFMPRPRRKKRAQETRASGARSVLVELEAHQVTMERRLRHLDEERDRIVDGIASSRRDRDADGEQLLGLDHLENRRLAKRTREVLGLVKSRTHKLRAAVYAIEEERTRAALAEAQARTDLDSWLSPDERARRRHDHARSDAHLSSYLEGDGEADVESDPVPEKERRRNQEAIEAALQDRDPIVHAERGPVASEVTR